MQALLVESIMLPPATIGSRAEIPEGNHGRKEGGERKNRSQLTEEDHEGRVSNPEGREAWTETEEGKGQAGVNTERRHAEQQSPLDAEPEHVLRERQAD